MSSEGLSLGYRIVYRLRRVVMSVYGPAELGDDDPLVRLAEERAAKIAEAKDKKTG